MAIEFISNLKSAWVEPGQSEPVTFGDFTAPSNFITFYTFTDEKTDRDWEIHFYVSVSKLGTPLLESVQVFGTKPTLRTPGGVERWQLKIAEEYRAQLLNLALRLAIETRWPTVMLKSEYNSENMAISRALSNAGIKRNQKVLAHPSEVDFTLESGEKGEFVRFWDGNPDALNSNELKKLQKLIGEKTRKKITLELLAEVARIYQDEATRIGGKPTKAVERELNCTSYRTAQDYVALARKAKLLPETTPGKVTVKKSTKRKEKK
jgi:hypothetical protein